jgi:hypothetical protein
MAWGYLRTLMVWLRDWSRVAMESSAAVGASRRPLGWLPWTALVLCVIGLADSGYQVYTHFTGTGLVGCSARADACVTSARSVSFSRQRS